MPANSRPRSMGPADVLHILTGKGLRFLQSERGSRAYLLGDRACRQVRFVILWKNLQGQIYEESKVKGRIVLHGEPWLIAPVERIVPDDKFEDRKHVSFDRYRLIDLESAKHITRVRFGPETMRNPVRYDNSGSMGLDPETGAILGKDTAGTDWTPLRDDDDEGAVLASGGRSVALHMARQIVADRLQVQVERIEITVLPPGDKFRQV